MRVYIWGTGVMASEYLKKKEIAFDDILGFIESKKQKNEFEGKRVFEPQEISNHYDYIIVCVKHVGRDIYRLCKEIGIDTSKLVLIDNWEWMDGSSIDMIPSKHCQKIVENEIDIQKIFPKLYESYIKENDALAERYTVVVRNGSDLCEKDSPMSSKEFFSKAYQTDYFRYRTFELVANEIIKKNIKGSVAEVGVFRGAFSKLINVKFKNKKLYLFDTFDSFDEEEFKLEFLKGRTPKEFLDGFRKTSVEMVLENMIYPDKCIIKKGLFPSTSVGLENELYAFVSIDVDFEKSILESLRYFYPRLNRGGAIFLHDYNNQFLEGVKRAVDIYENEIGGQMYKVPLADEGGTLVILK